MGQVKMFIASTKDDVAKTAKDSLKTIHLKYDAQISTILLLTR